MGWYVATTDGGTVFGKDKEAPNGRMEEAAAKASAEERNKRAEALGIKARYQAVGG